MGIVGIVVEAGLILVLAAGGRLLGSGNKVFARQGDVWQFGGREWCGARSC